MSTVSETHDVSPAASGDAHAGTHDHPSDLKYVKIAIILAVLTAAEVLTYTFDITGGLLVAILIPMMIVKFAIVAGYFMHLKFDKPILTRIFYSGLVLAMLVYLAMLTTFRFWF